MINTKDLTEKDRGRWVVYSAGVGQPPERGRIKSWNDSNIFVVFKCNGDWDKYEKFTAQAVKPEDVYFITKTAADLPTPLPSIVSKKRFLEITGTLKAAIDLGLAKTTPELEAVSWLVANTVESHRTDDFWTGVYNGVLISAGAYHAKDAALLEYGGFVSDVILHAYLKNRAARSGADAILDESILG